MIGTRADVEHDWRGYARSVLLFNLAGFLVLYLILRTQSIHPFNPSDLGAPPWDLSFNTAASFVSNTNWQFYGGETTMSYFSQMAGLALQNFLSAATGIAVVAAVIRGFARRGTDRLGNFWVDVTRVLLYVLVPVCVVGALFLVSQGVIQTLDGTAIFETLNGGSQGIALGPVASQEIIKELGTNGGGFFNINASSPFENPSGLTNFFLMLMILVIPAGLTGAFGRMVGNRRQGWAIYAAMLVMFVAAVAVLYTAESGHDAGAGRRGHRGRQLRRQGAAIRHRLIEPVRGDHHGRLLRGGERRDGVALGARRNDPAREHDDRRGHLRRRRLGPLRHAPLRPPRRVPGGPDGRPHAGVPGQEDRGA